MPSVTVFILHFEAGGTLLNLDPEKTRAYYFEQFEKARREHTPLGLGRLPVQSHSTVAS